MHEPYNLCRKLKAPEVCLVVERYIKGAYLGEFHRHVSNVLSSFRIFDYVAHEP